jgi:tetratricopeptide (TPR) repeat protein
MGGPQYLDLDVLFSKSGSGYQAMITRSPAGDGQYVTFGPVLSELELENFVLKVGRFRSRTRRIDAAPVAAAKQVGGRLFDAVFTGAVGNCLGRSLDRAREEDAALRIRLRMSGCPELADLPWELLYDRDDDWFLALSDRTPVVRYVQLPNPPRTVPVTLPLRVLVIKSEPADYPPLELAAEWAQVAESLRELTESDDLAFTELAAPTLGELRRALARDSFHVLHFMGHGGFDAERGGVLLFTDRAGRGVPVTSGDLGVMLHDHVSLRLAVLNACEAGRTDPVDPFAGVADMLVRRGIPAVVAMQFEVSDDAAVEFAPALYGALAAGRPVDMAVAEARKAMYTVSPLEWATPVLYLRADDARLFTISPRARSAATPATSRAGERNTQTQTQPPPDTEAALREAIRLNPASPVAHSRLGLVLHDSKRYAEAEAAYREAIRLDPGYAQAHSGLGWVLRDTERYAEAEATLREAIRLDPASPVARSGLGWVLDDLLRYAEAEAALREAIRLDPGYAKAHTGLGWVLWGTERYAEAEATLREAIRLDPASPVAHGGLGVVLHTTKRYAEAEAALREAIRVDPSYAKAYNNLGLLLRDTERYAEAEAVLREAIRLDPGRVLAHNNLGLVLHDTKRYAEAEAAYREALRLDPGYALAQENLALLLRTRKRPGEKDR